MIIWKSHPEEPVEADKRVLLKYKLYSIDRGKVIEDCKFVYFRCPSKDYPEKYQPNYFEMSSDNVYWADAPKSFEWTELD